MHDDVFRVRSTANNPHHMIADLPARDARTHRLDFTSVFETRDVCRPSRWRRIHPATLHQIGPIDSGRTHTHADVIWTSFGSRGVAELKNFRTARPRN